MYEVPIKFVFRGDRLTAMTFRRRGQVLMRMLENFMSYRGLEQGVLRRFVRPDVLIECEKRFGLRTVTITTVPVVIEARRQVEQSTGLLVAVSDSTGVHLYDSQSWEENFRYRTPMYGYYEAIPDWYQFNRPFRGSWNTWAFPSTNILALSRVVDTALENDGMDTMITRIWYVEEFDLQVYGWYGLGRLTVNSSPTGCKWCRPVLMPWSDKKIISAFVTAYGGENVDEEDLPDGYQPYDAMTIADIGLGRYDAQGAKHARSYAWRRGNSAGSSYGDVGPIVPLPIHNGVRRYVGLRWGGEVFREAPVDPVLFRLTSIRSEQDIRYISFPAALLAEHLPEWLHEYLHADGPIKHYFHVMGSWAHALEDTGELIVHLVLLFGSTGGDFEYGEYQYDPQEQPNIYARLNRRKWGSCICRFVIPAAEFDMTPADEESFILQNTQVEDLITADQFLPLLDMLFRENKEKLYFDDGVTGEAEFDYFLSPTPEFLKYPPHVLYREDQDDGFGKRFLNYTVGDTIYNDPNGVPYDIMNGEIHIMWGHAFSILDFIFTRGEIHDQKTLFSYGDTAYSWTRHFGGIAVTPQGMVPQDMTWPEVITEDVRTRPDVTYAGNGLWCCVCERMGERVMGVFIGTPFQIGTQDAWWTEIKLVTEEWAAAGDNRIVYVRPLRVTAERVVLLAIVRSKTDEEEQVRYQLAVCDGMPSEPDSTLLKFYGDIPVNRDDEGMSFDVCVLDNQEEYAKMLISYPTPPIAFCAVSYNKNDMQYRMAVQSYWEGIQIY